MDKIQHIVDIGIFTLNYTGTRFFVEKLIVQLSVEVVGIAVLDKRMKDMLLIDAF